MDFFNDLIKKASEELKNSSEYINLIKRKKVLLDRKNFIVDEIYESRFEKNKLDQLEKSKKMNDEAIKDIDIEINNLIQETNAKIKLEFLQNKSFEQFLNS